MASRRQTALFPPGIGSFLRRRMFELSGLVLLALAVALILSLASFDPSDPSLNTAGGGDINNLLGYPGAVISDLALQTIGLATGLVVVVLITWGLRLLRRRAVPRALLRITILLLSLTVAALAFAAVPVPETWPLIPGLGGLVGGQIRVWLAALSDGHGVLTDSMAVGLVAGGATLAAMVWLIGYSLAEWRGGWAWLEGLAGAMRRPPEKSPNRRTSKRTKSPEDPAGRAEPYLDGAGIADAAAPQIDSPPRRSRLEKPKPPKRAARASQAALRLSGPEGEFQFPPLDLLQAVPESGGRNPAQGAEALEQNARLLEQVLADFGVRGEIIKVRPGPVVTLYELEPAPGIKTSRVIGLADDIARSMSALSTRIATIPGRSVIGIELPNAKRQTVFLRELFASRAYEQNGAALPLVMGKDIGGAPVVVDLARMPHLLVAGTTGAGKSVGLNAMILSLLYRLPPETCKFIMIDPKMLELSIYNDIPHLMTPVVTEPKKAIVALKWTVREMEERYRAMSKLGVRNVEGYNKRLAEARRKGEVLMRKVQTGFDSETGRPVHEEQPLELTPLPYIVVVVDEMADLMMVAGKEIEAAIQRLSQMARAAGIHLIMATQRPSVDVVTGTIKANFPTRISFQVTSKIDSRTILGEQGAEQLLGQGDMLYMAGGGRISRIHGPFVDDYEVEAVTDFLRGQGEPIYIESITEEDEEAAFDSGGNKGGDELYQQAVDLVVREGRASTSFVQRHLQIGYNRAARIIEQMEKQGVVSQANHVGKREVLSGGGSH